MYTRSAQTLAVLMLCSSCTGDEDRTARVSLDLTATPLVALDDAFLEEARVTIERIDLLGYQDAVVALREEPVTIDLAELSEATAEMVRDEVVPPGLYHELRFVMSGGYLRIAGEGLFSTPDYPEVPADAEVTGKLQMPSLAQSGLKVKLAEPLFLEVPQTIVMARFDVAESFGHGTGTDKWLMHPVITGAEIDATATLTVNVDARALAWGGSQIALRVDDASGYLEARESFVATAQPGVWRATLSGLLPSEGPYRVSIESAEGIVASDLPSSLTLAAGDEIELDASVSGS